jgi:2-polyprenyl-6-methoxyphenol hydroxylase-like FAD-dependent oxidoreductase
VSGRIAPPGGERVVRARYLVGCDGGSSLVRKGLGIEFRGETLGVRAIVADVLVDGVSSDAWHRWGEGTAAQVALRPLCGTDMIQLQGPIPFGVDVDLSAEGLTAWLCERTGRADVVVESIYGLSPGQRVLVRPDGYVACVVDADAIESVEDYLHTVGVRRPR